MKNSEFLTAMVIIQDIFSFAHPLSANLQAKQNDLASAMSMADDLILLLKDLRENAETKYHELFTSTEELGDQIGEEIKTPRVTQRQSHRANYQSQCPEEYYCISIYSLP